MLHFLRAPLLLLLLVLAASAFATDFPEPDALPLRKEFPDPLVMMDGTRVTTKEQWLEKRKPELRALFSHYMYGVAPPATKVRAKVERVDRKALGGKATLKEITLTVGGPEAPKMHLLLVVPNQRSGPAPVFLGLNFGGNHLTLADPQIRLPAGWLPKGSPGVVDNRATDQGRGAQTDTWAIEQTIDRGYAVALVYCGDIDPDRADKREGIQPHVTPKEGAFDWGSIRAWAWGLQRVIDYLETDGDVDAARIIVVGHSRLGKTALVCGAYDDRPAMIIPHQAGCGGTSPSRGTVGESVKVITQRFPHWFGPRFKQFAEEPGRLPFDQHCLIALCAPRPVLLTNAVQDQWANPAGQFDMLVAADPVYRLLGVEGVGVQKMPEVGRLVDSRLGYFIRDGKHSMTRADWQVYLDFADKHLRK